MGNSGSDQEDDEISDDEYVPSGVAAPAGRSSSPALAAVSQPAPSSSSTPKPESSRNHMPIKSLITDDAHNRQQPPMMIPSAAMFPQPSAPFYLASPIMIPFPKGMPMPTMIPGHMAGVMPAGMMTAPSAYVGPAAVVAAPSSAGAAAPAPPTTDEEAVIQTLGSLC